MKARTLSALALAALLAGCGDATPPAVQTAKRPNDSAQQRAPEKRETVFDPWVGTIDRAKGVQSTVDEQAAEQRRKLEEASR